MPRGGHSRRVESRLGCRELRTVSGLQIDQPERDVWHILESLQLHLGRDSLLISELDLIAMA